jgi:EAL domain-containing protein (putative c-di-GMP-specific phosphodiesterase class I)
MAYQPIIDVAKGEVFAFEALVRGEGGEGALSVLSAVDPENRYAFDQACRIKAIEVASGLRLQDTPASVSINFMPNAVYQPEACIRATLATAERTAFPLDRIIFEVTEGEQVVDQAHLSNIITAYREMGFRTAIDDFGAGFSNLNLLAEFQPDILKLDMLLIRNIDSLSVKRAIVRSVISVCQEIGSLVIAEGVETADEHQALLDLGIELFQGYLYARPGFETLPEPVWPAPIAGQARAQVA